MISDFLVRVRIHTQNGKNIFFVAHRQSKKTLSGVFFVLFGLNCMKPRRAESAGANRCAAACGGGRRGGEVKKQGAVRSAPSEQCDYVSEGQLQVLLPLPKQSSEIVGI